MKLSMMQIKLSWQCEILHQQFFWEEASDTLANQAHRGAPGECPVGIINIEG